MLFEDDIGILEVTTEILNLEGFEVCHAMFGSETKALLELEQPNLILLDMFIPGQSFHNTLNLIRAYDPECPVVIFSANNSIEQITREVGAEGFIRKPYDADELIGMISRLIELRKCVAKS
jgi:two-component system, OmpR family, response regulator CpxR